MPYHNAAEILPASVLREVQKYFTGRLYVPASNAFYRERERTIIKLWQDGKSAKEIAEKVCLCERRVQQVIRAHKKTK